MTDIDLDELKKELQNLKEEHIELDEITNVDVDALHLCQFTLQKLKKRKLFVKDRIKQIKEILYPNIIA